MKYIYQILILFIITSCSNTPKSELIGVWKSDTDKSIAYLNSIEGVPDKIKENLINDVFVKMISEFRDGKMKVTFEKCNDTIWDCEEMQNFEKYKLINENKDHFIIQYYDDVLKEDVLKTLYREGNCYYLQFAKWELREYYCK